MYANLTLVSLQADIRYLAVFTMEVVVRMILGNVLQKVPVQWLRKAFGVLLMLTLAACSSDNLYEGVAPIGRVVSDATGASVLRGDRLMGLGPKAYLYPGDAMMTPAAQTRGLVSVIQFTDKTRIELSQDTQLDLVALDPAEKTMRLVLTKGRITLKTGKIGKATVPGYEIVTRMGMVKVHQGEVKMLYHSATDLLDVGLVEGKPVVVTNVFGRSELDVPGTVLSVRFGGPPSAPLSNTESDF